MDNQNSVFNIIEEISVITKLLDNQFFVVGSLVDIIYLDIDRKLKDVDIIYFGQKNLDDILPHSYKSSGLYLSEKRRLKAGSIYLEIFENDLSCKYTYFEKYQTNIQTALSRYNFINNFLKIKEKRSWSNIYRFWFREKKKYFNLIKSKYEYNIID